MLGLLETITSTADSKDCPGVCVHTLATLICYEVLENVICPSPSMKCCIEPSNNVSIITTTSAIPYMPPQLYHVSTITTGRPQDVGSDKKKTEVRAYYENYAFGVSIH